MASPVHEGPARVALARVDAQCSGADHSVVDDFRSWKVKNASYEIVFEYGQRKNRLLKVCYVPTTSPTFNAFFLAVPINNTNETIKAGGTCHYMPLISLSFLDVYGAKARMLEMRN